MSGLDPPVTAVRAVVRAALAEDFGTLGDLTSIAVVPEDARGAGRFVARRGGVIAGTAAAGEVFRQVDSSVAVRWTLVDGDAVDAGAELGRVDGKVRSILGAERTALNLLCHCSGVATLTRRFVDAVADTGTRIRDTRKTHPGLRALEKAAVRAGGGFNHRECLSDAVLIKDNHLAHLPLWEAVERARACWPGRVVEVECDSLEQVAEAKTVGPDLVLVDNMSPADVREAVAVLGGAIPVEVSGGVDLDTVRAYAAAGADYIAVGAITHSAPILDIALDSD
ncbi:MAG: carboxylating nicotinate-nucleotide diphosphorylase [Acidimicrobiia bacterium]